MPEAATGTREITFAEAIREALAEEMRRDSRVFIMGEDVAEAGTPFKVLSGLVEEFGTSRVVDTPISEAGFTGVGVGAAMTGLAPGRRHHVRRFRDADHGSNGEPGGKSSLHVRREMESAHGDAHNSGSGATFGRATFAIASCLVQPRSRIESGAAFHTVRREGFTQDRDSRRQSRRFLRR